MAYTVGFCREKSGPGMPRFMLALGSKSPGLYKYARVSAPLFCLLILLDSCKLFYPSRMFQQGDYQSFVVDPVDINEYLIQPGDEIILGVFAKQGFDLVDVLNLDQQGENQVGTSSISYFVDKDGFVEVPILGRVYVEGYAESELVNRLETGYSSFFIEPYVVLRVYNRRVSVFVGDQGAVVKLNPTPTTLIEVLAKTGGVNRYSRVNKITVIRGDKSNPEVFTIDLSTIEGMMAADLVLQSNDVIYSNERYRISSVLLSEITPILGVVTGLLQTILIVRAFQQ